jgi:nitroimidazol reductase NimA-like FMN-containing flavoprotein (pyridoxamine 5'-phosphate oxidase superfamily)
MPQPHLTEQERQAFLAEPRVGVLSVASGDDRPPLTVPLWYGYQPGGNLTYSYLDLTPLGRQEDCEQPAGRSDTTAQGWVRYHDTYEREHAA